MAKRGVAAIVVRAAWGLGALVPGALVLPVLLLGAAGATGEELVVSGEESVCVPPTEEQRHAVLADALEVSPEAVAQFERAGEAMARGEYAEARRDYLEAARVARAAGRPVLAARASANAIRAALDADQLEGLEAELAALEATAAALPDARDRARVLINVARSQLRASEALPARRSALRARAASSFALARVAADASGDLATESYALAFLGELYESEGRFDEALRLTRRALFAAQEADVPEALYRWEWQLGRIQRARGEQEAALVAYRAAVRTLGELHGQVAVHSSDVQATFRAQVAPVYDGLADLLLSRVSPSGETAADQALLREARGAIEDLKAAELRDYFHDECLDAQRKASPDDIPGALVVYPIILPDRLELIASEGGRLMRYTVPVDAATLIREVHAFRATLVKRTTYQYLSHARTLYDWLIRPLKARLEGESVNTLVWIPGGALRMIPIAPLLDRETKQFLVEKIAVAIAPGLTLIEPRKIDRGTVEILAAAVSDANMGYPALVNVPREVETVSSVFPTRQLMNEEFSVDNFSRQMASAPHGIVHIASHGEFAADVSESYLLAYGEKLSMAQVAQLVSATRFRDQPLELLTLSACKTAAGDERSALGLAGVALQSGARSALATLWSVDDGAAADLVSEFYVQLGKPELSRAEALRRAQLDMLGRFRYRHAAYWAPFLLISSWL